LPATLSPERKISCDARHDTEYSRAIAREASVFANCVYHETMMPVLYHCKMTVILHGRNKFLSTRTII